MSWDWKSVGVDSVELLLHDGMIDLDMISEHAGAVRILGILEKPVSDSFFTSIGKYTFGVLVEGVTSWSLRDEAGVGVLPIDRFRLVDGVGMVVSSVLPVELVLCTQDKFLSVAVANEPFEVKKLFQWKSVRVKKWPPWSPAGGNTGG